MAVTDRWHKTYPNPDKGDEPCRCGTKRTPLYPSAEHLKGKRWQVRYRDDTGKQTSRNFELKEGRNKELHAEAFDADVNSHLNAGTYIDPRAGDITLRKYAAEWRENLTVDASTLAWIDDALRWVHEHSIADTEIGKLSKRPSLIKSWVGFLDERLAASTIRTYFGALSSIFVSAIDDELIVKNPCRAKSVRLPTVYREEVVPLTLAQADAIRDDLPSRLKAMVDLGIGTGLRQGELMGFSPDDVDWLRGTVKVLRQIKVVEVQDGEPVMIFALPKHDKTRSIPLSPGVAQKLAAHLQEFPAIEVTLPWDKPEGRPTTVALMFTWSGRRDNLPRPIQRPTPIHRSNMNDLWRRSRHAAGLPHERKYGMHTMRHTFASAALAGGVDLKRLSNDLGHASIATTDRIYTHLMPNTEGRVRTALDAFFAGEFETPSALNVPLGPPAEVVPFPQQTALA